MKSLDININQVADVLVLKFVTDGGSLSVLKLQKLLYYVEAWYVALNNEALFKAEFEAWMHGPACPVIFQRFKHQHNKTLYSNILIEDIDAKAAGAFIEQNRSIDEHIDNVLEVYGGLSGPQLEELTHNETPWLNARGALKAYQACDHVISKESMRCFYKQQLSSAS